MRCSESASVPKLARLVSPTRRPVRAAAPLRSQERRPKSRRTRWRTVSPPASPDLGSSSPPASVEQRGRQTIWCFCRNVPCEFRRRSKTTNSVIQRSGPSPPLFRAWPVCSGRCLSAQEGETNAANTRIRPAALLDGSHRHQRSSCSGGLERPVAGGPPDRVGDHVRRAGGRPESDPAARDRQPRRRRRRRMLLGPQSHPPSMKGPCPRRRVAQEEARTPGQTPP